MAIKPIKFERIKDRYIEEAGIIYPSRVFRIIEQAGVKLDISTGGNKDRVNVAVDKDERIVAILSYG